MKKLFVFISFIFIFCLFSTLTLPSRTVSAESLYLRIIAEDTPFYQKSSDKEPLFFLPYTYYVKVIESEKSFTRVECKPNSNAPAIDGFVPTDMLFSDGLEVSEPYLSLNIKTATTAVLFEDSSLSTPLQYVFPEREMNYYGKYVNQAGRIIYYVSYNERLGYVKESDIYPFTYPNHPNELTFLNTKSPTLPQDESQNAIINNDATLSIKIIIIACLLFAGIVALIFAIKNRPTRASYSTIYDENDYE